LSALLARLQNDRNALGLLFLLPTALLLLLFLTYPLGLGTWLGFTDTKIGRGGEWIGLENYEFLWGDEVTRLALFNTIFYTVVASVIKFGLGLWLALLLNKHLPFKAFLRAIVLLPFIEVMVPNDSVTALRPPMRTRWAAVTAAPGSKSWPSSARTCSRPASAATTSSSST